MEFFLHLFRIKQAQNAEEHVLNSDWPIDMEIGNLDKYSFTIFALIYAIKRTEMVGKKKDSRQMLFIHFRCKFRSFYPGGTKNLKRKRIPDANRDEAKLADNSRRRIK